MCNVHSFITPPDYMVFLFLLQPLETQKEEKRKNEKYPRDIDTFSIITMWNTGFAGPGGQYVVPSSNLAVEVADNLAKSIRLRALNDCK